MLFLKYIPELNESEYQIYEFIINNTDIVPYLTIRELSEKLFISTASVFRFCKKFECDGYSEFKSKLKIYLASKDEERGLNFFDETALIEFVKRSTESSFNGLIQKAANFINEHEFVFFMGYGRSNITAQYATTYFATLRTFAFSVDTILKNPTTTITTEAASRSCFVVFSVSGENDRILKNILHFKSMGVKIISITNSSKCTASSLSDINIPYYITEEKIKTADITSQIPAIFIIEKLAKEVAQLKMKK